MDRDGEQISAPLRSSCHPGSNLFVPRGRSPQFEDVLLLLVVGEDLPVGAGEGQRLLAVIRGAVAETLGVLVG